jgi:quinohemoprotein ethanol dehydrogenase
MSYSPATGLSYIPASEQGSVYADPPGDLAQWKPLPNYAINNAIGAADPPIEVPPPKSSLLAWDPVRQKAVWEVPLSGVINGGTAATAGNLVLAGRATGEFAAYAADTGRRLWSFDAQAGIQAQPITYMAGGRQYVTVIAGWRSTGRPSGAVPEWEYRLQPRRVLTFALDATAALPPPGPRTLPFLDDPQFVIDPAKAARGEALTRTRCLLCHGIALAAAGTAPDLRRSPMTLSREALSAVLLRGSLLAAGMPRFEEFSAADVEDIQHYVRRRARESIAASQ